MQCERLKAENDKIKASNKILERHIAMQEKATREWANTLKQVTFIHAKKNHTTNTYSLIILLRYVRFMHTPEPRKLKQNI